MVEPIRASLLFLINTLFDVYSFILIVRIFLVYSGAHYFDPITQFVTRFTNFIIKPMKRIFPNYHRIELASIILIFTLEIVKFLLLAFLLRAYLPPFISIVILACGDFLKLILLTLFYAILLQAILSWIQPYSLLSQSLFYITSPVLRPIQRYIPPLGGFDLSPLIALLVLQLLIILLASPLIAEGLNRAGGSGI